MREYSPGVASSAGLRTFVPALFTRQSRPSQCDDTSDSSASLPSGVATSATHPYARFPNRATAALTSAPFRPFTMTSAPRSMNSLAAAKPIPLVLPVMSTR